MLEFTDNKLRTTLVNLPVEIDFALRCLVEISAAYT